MKNRGRRGFTLIELTIAMVILVIVSLAIFSVLRSSTVEYTNLSLLGDLQNKARIITDRLSSEMRAADTFKNFSLLSGEDNSICFRAPKRVDESSGAIIWSDMDDPIGQGAGAYKGTLYLSAPCMVCYRIEPSKVDATNNNKPDDGRFVRVLQSPPGGPPSTDIAGTKLVLSDYLQLPLGFDPTYVQKPKAGNGVFRRGTSAAVDPNTLDQNTVYLNLNFRVSDDTGKQNKILKRQIVSSISIRNNSQ